MLWGLVGHSSFGSPGLCQRAASLAPAPVHYRVDLSSRERHEARIEARFELRALESRGPTLDVVMSRSSPGRYAVHDFAKNVYDVEAVDQRGWQLPLERVSPHVWRVDVSAGAQEVRFLYTLYADRCDGTYSAIDRSHAHLNAPATFVWSRGFEALAHEVHIEVPEGWRVATQLPHRRDGGAYVGKDLAELLDSPIEVSAHSVRGFNLPAPEGETAQEVLVAMHHQGSASDLDSYVRHTEAIVLEASAVFGGMPRFDHGRYTFLADYLPWCSGDGMEHRNSTVLTSALDLESGEERLLGTVAHEFFHAWNIERMRPRTLEPFDFERANMSDALWFGEGFTSYYDRLLTHRAGVSSLDSFAERIGDVVDAVLRTPAARRSSPVEASQQAPFVDAATANDPTNRENTYLSYYTWGAGVGLALDLSLRERSGRSLDGFLRAVWARHPDVEQPYELEDLVVLLAGYAGDEIWAQDFFARFVNDGNPPDFERLLGLAGLRLRRAEPERTWLGVEVDDGEGAVILSSNPIEGSPAHRARLSRGDRVLRVEGREVDSAEQFDELVAEAGAGESITLQLDSRGVTFEVALVPASHPRWEVVPFENLDLEVSPAAREFREEWLSARRPPEFRIGSTAGAGQPARREAEH